MTDPNDKSLDEYLRRDSVVSQRYREIEAEEVPPELDATVLAQARAATTQQRMSKPAWMKWSAPLALAASAVLIVTIVLEVGVQEDARIPAAQVEQKAISQPTPEARVVQDVIQEAPTTAAAPPPPKLESPAAPTDNAALELEALAPKEMAPKETAAKSTEREAVESVVVTESKPGFRPQDAPMPATAMNADSRADAPSESDAARPDKATVDSVAQPSEQARAADLDEIVVTGANFERVQARQRSAPVPPRAGTVMTQPSAAPEAQQVPRIAPDVWLEQIRALRREGKVLEADEQWKEFRAAYPDFEVADADLARPAR